MEPRHRSQQLPDELGIAAIELRVHLALDGCGAILMDEPTLEPVVAARVIEVVVSVQREHVVAGQLLGGRADVADSQARVDQRRGGIALDEEAVHVRGLADQMNPGLKLPGGKPASQEVTILSRMSAY